jgi:rubrerythrin
MEAFAGESQARGRYYYFAAKAREEGYGAVARYFEETAVNEQEHAKLWFKFLRGIGSTKENLQVAINGENVESSKMYPEFAKVAREEGFEDIAKMFESVAGIEKNHEEHFKLLLGQHDSVVAVVPNRWKCNNCGNIVHAKMAPGTCPVCSYADIGWSGTKAYKQITDDE